VKRFARGAVLLFFPLALAGCEAVGLRDRPPPRPAAESPLKLRLDQIATESDGMVGISVLHMRTGARTSVHGDTRLPMMSVFKLPLAVVTLAAVDSGHFKMDQPIPIAASEIVPDVSPIAEAWNKGEHSPKLETLLRQMIQQSDNTAGDKLVSLNGGGAKITARLKKMGLQRIDIAEQEINIFGRVHCAGDRSSGWTPAKVAECKEASPKEQETAAKQEVSSPPNGATTNSMIELLAAIDHGTILSKTSQQWLLAALAGVATGPHRIKGLLPDGTPVAHKTGTGDTVLGMNIAINDVGIVTLPNRDRYAIAVFIAGAHADPTKIEELIAKASRVVWDSYVTPPP
jgi:beta-lactamase class A